MALGRTVADKLKPGDVVAFYGDLGAGKTTMIKGVCAGLGVTETVKSPSFVIATEYSAARHSEFPVYHIDLYRLGVSELEGIDFEEYLEAGGICLIEWAERAEALLPACTIRVRLTLEGQGRRVEITWPDQVRRVGLV